MYSRGMQFGVLQYFEMVHGFVDFGIRRRRVQFIWNRSSQKRHIKILCLSHSDSSFPCIVNICIEIFESDILCSFYMYGIRVKGADTDVTKGGQLTFIKIFQIIFF